MRVLYVTKAGDRMVAPTPTIDDLCAHAERHGVHMVAETGVDCGYSLDMMTRLIDKLDKIDRQHHKQKKLWALKHYVAPKKDAEFRAKKMLGIKDEDEA